jgi:hypothetical protein
MHFFGDTVGIVKYAYSVPTHHRQLDNYCRSALYGILAINMNSDNLLNPVCNVLMNSQIKKMTADLQLCLDLIRVDSK